MSIESEEVGKEVTLGWGESRLTKRGMERYAPATRRRGDAS